MSRNKRKRKINVLHLMLVILLAVCSVALLAAGVLRVADYLADRKNGLADGGVITVEYGTGSADPLDYIDQAAAQVSVKDDQKIDTHKLGDQKITFIVSKKGLFGTSEKEFTRVFTVSDTKAPVITAAGTDLARAVNDVLGLQDLIICSDPADGELTYSDTLSPGTWTGISDADMGKAGTYTVQVRAMDSNGNTAEAALNLRVAGDPSDRNSFYIKVNRAANTVTIYEKKADGTAGTPLKAMVCSTGPATPLGTYNTFNRSAWRSLFGGVYGQYATDITGDILFHSVPYYSASKNNLEYLEYNKLGTAASMGCVRLCVRDAKWIFENCAIGTTVEFYDDAEEPGPLGKPEPITIDTASADRGWDPTDPDPQNPWN